jgi:predicted ferric reductase
MHAILFQMALLPLSMRRFTLAQLSHTPLLKYVPFNKITAMHIHLGYTKVLIVFLATVFFFGFFGMLCQDQKNGTEKLGPGEEHTFCMKFETEIMRTGFGILGCLLLIGGTSFWRSHIPYELFYAVHHLVFLMFALAIAHTVDIQQIQGTKDRSQVWKWVSVPLLYVPLVFRCIVCSCTCVLGVLKFRSKGV